MSDPNLMHCYSNIYSEYASFGWRRIFFLFSDFSELKTQYAKDNHYELSALPKKSEEFKFKILYFILKKSWFFQRWFFVYPWKPFPMHKTYKKLTDGTHLTFENELINALANPYEGNCERDHFVTFLKMVKTHGLWNSDRGSQFAAIFEKYPDPKNFRKFSSINRYLNELKKIRSLEGGDIDRVLKAVHPCGEQVSILNFLLKESNLLNRDNLNAENNLHTIMSPKGAHGYGYWHLIWQLLIKLDMKNEQAQHYFNIIMSIEQPRLLLSIVSRMEEAGILNPNNVSALLKNYKVLMIKHCYDTPIWEKLPRGVFTGQAFFDELIGLAEKYPQLDPHNIQNIDDAQQAIRKFIAPKVREVAERELPHIISERAKRHFLENSSSLQNISEKELLKIIWKDIKTSVINTLRDEFLIGFEDPDGQKVLAAYERDGYLIPGVDLSFVKPPMSCESSKHSQFFSNPESQISGNGLALTPTR